MYIPRTVPKEAAVTALQLDRDGRRMRFGHLARLPGVEPAEWHYSADVRHPDEIAAFYDDVRNVIRIESQLVLLVLDDWCSTQLPLL